MRYSLFFSEEESYKIILSAYSGQKCEKWYLFVKNGIFYTVWPEYTISIKQLLLIYIGDNFFYKLRNRLQQSEICNYSETRQFS